jgi:hypothetical protein
MGLVVDATDEFIAKAKAMTDEELLATTKRYRAEYNALEQERMQCWNRMMEIELQQNAMGGEMQALGTIACYGRKLKVD